MAYNSVMFIRHTTYDDLDTLKDLFGCARKYMKDHGNPSQWKDNRPDIRLIETDIENNNSYVIEDEGKIVGTFACIKGIEPTYLDIEGQWLNDDEYVTIHRIASNGSKRGIFNEAIDFAEKFGVDIRIDTHKDNLKMRQLIKDKGFVYCGIIIVDDGTERLAYQKLCRKS